ncbi:MAG: SGNH/GDSL hydrolase family protein [Anaerolineales bacterium]
MTKRISRREFLSLGLTTALSACAPKLGMPTAKPSVDISAAKTKYADTTPRIYAPDDPNLQYTGRIDFSNPKEPQFSAPGVYLHAHFRGTGVAVMLEDEFQWGTNRNYYDAVINEETVVKITPEKGFTRYEVASGLSNAYQTITLVKRTEASIGFSKFLGIEIAGELTPPGERPARRIEFIGDSITAGAGIEAFNDSSDCLVDGWGQPYNNARLAYGPVLARSLGAEYHVSAVSGIGLVRNYSFQYDARPMPDVYDLTFFEQTASPKWDTRLFIPDAVVVALGTNDFSPGDSEREGMSVDAFAAAYIAFIEKLRGYYPKAEIFGVSSPMLGDHWPAPADTFATDQKKAIALAVETLNGKGDPKVHAYTSLPIVGIGCGTHPNVEQQAMLAAQLRTAIAPVMGW